MTKEDPRKENHKNQPRVAGRFAKDSSKPNKTRVSLRVDAAILAEYKKNHGIGFSGQLAKIIEEYMQSENKLAQSTNNVPESSDENTAESSPNIDSGIPE